MTVKKQRDMIGVLLNLFFALVAIFILAPIIVVIVNSFNGVAYSVFPLQGVSLRWYEKLTTESGFISGALKSIQVSSWAVIIAMVVGVPAAYALSRFNFPFKNMIYSFLVLPLAVPKIVMGLALFVLFVKVKIYGTLFGLAIAHSFLALPFVIVMVSAAVKGIPRAQEEAAMDLGARPLKTFFQVIIPQIMVAMILSASLGFVFSFDQVEASIFLVRSGNYTLPLEMMVYMEKYQDPTIAALSTVMIMCVLLLAFIVYLSVRKKEMNIVGKTPLN
jgi:putative spermidine/putrescine transport system permease protein